MVAFIQNLFGFQLFFVIVECLASGKCGGFAHDSSRFPRELGSCDDTFPDALSHFLESTAECFEDTPEVGVDDFNFNGLSGVSLLFKGFVERGMVASSYDKNRFSISLPVRVLEVDCEGFGAFFS